MASDYCMNHTRLGPFLRSAVKRKRPGTSLVVQVVKDLPTKRETRFSPWVEKIPWRREWLPTSILLPGESQGQRIKTFFIKLRIKELICADYIGLCLVQSRWLTAVHCNYYYSNQRRQHVFRHRCAKENGMFKGWCTARLTRGKAGKVGSKEFVKVLYCRTKLSLHLWARRKH